MDGNAEFKGLFPGAVDIVRKLRQVNSVLSYFGCFKRFRFSVDIHCRINLFRIIFFKQDHLIVEMVVEAALIFLSQTECGPVGLLYQARTT